jgi:outer membrane usher protein
VLNYDAVATLFGERTLGEALLDGRVFTPLGVMTTSVLAMAGNSPGINPMVRLDSAYSYSDPDTLRRYVAGDLITAGLAWTRPVRLGGAQITTDFAIRPDLVTFPVPSIAGQVAVPSTINVLINGVQLLSREIPPGPFELPQLPVVTGTSDVSVVVRDALGRQTTQMLPFYASSRMLEPGLSSFAVELGAVRLNYGVVSNDYRSPAGSVSYRRGIADWLSGEAHAEAANGAAMGGAGLVFAAGTLGSVSIAGAYSGWRGRSGGLLWTSFERITPGLSLTGSLQLAGRSFRDIAAAYGEPVPRLLAQGSFGVPLGAWGSIGVAYTRLRQEASTLANAQRASDFGLILPSPTPPLLLLVPTRVSLISASYSTQVFGGRAFFYATGFHDFANQSSTGAVLGITIPLGRRSSAGITAGTNSGSPFSSLQATRSTVEVGDLGGQVLISEGNPSRQMAIGEYKSPWALIDVGADRIAGQTAWRGTAQGALAFAGGGLFAANPIRDSFAVVDTAGTEGVQVLYENRPFDRTGPSGQVLVPDLRSFDANRLSIDPSDVPLDADLGPTTQLVRPQDRSGVVVRFPVRPSRGALLHLVDPSGAVLPVGSPAKLLATGKQSSVGYGGQAFLRGLDRHNVLVVTLPNGNTCSAIFDYRPQRGTIPQIGPLTCRPSALP